METNEIWKPISDFPGYEVSDLGNIRSYKVPGSSKPHPTPHLLKPRPNKYDNRLWVSLSRNGQSHSLSVHRLVLTAFVGICPPGMECCHYDGNCHNNTLTNLRWATHSDNAIDNVRLGVCTGDNSSQSKITSSTAQYIREQYQNGVPVSQLLNEVPINKRNIYAVIYGESWQSAGGPIHQPTRRSSSS